MTLQLLGRLKAVLQVLKESAGRLALAVVVLVTAGLGVVFLGALFPHRHGDNLSDSLNVSIGKLEFLVLVALTVVPFYLDIGTDIVALKGFFNPEQWAYFAVNGTAILTSALFGAALVFQEHGICLAVASATQCLPAGCLIFTLYGFVFAPNPAELKSFISDSGINALLSSTSLVEGLLEALVSSEVQTHAIIMTDWQEKQGQEELNNLLLSACISMLSMAYTLAKLDKRLHVTRYIKSSPFLCGTATMTSPAFMLVASYRLCSIVSRMLLFPFFSELVELHFAALLFMSFDFVIQVAK